MTLFRYLGNARRVRILRWILWLVFCGAVLYRGIAVESEGIWGYLLYLPETALVLMALFVSWLGKPTVRGWVFYVVCLLIPLSIGVGVVPKQVASATNDESELGEYHQIRLVSANLDSWRTDVEQAARTLADQEPDLLCLQEVWSEKHLDAIRKEFPDFEFVGTELPLRSLRSTIKRLCWFQRMVLKRTVTGLSLYLPQ